MTEEIDYERLCKYLVLIVWGKAPGNQDRLPSPDETPTVWYRTPITLDVDSYTIEVNNTPGFDKYVSLVPQKELQRRDRVTELANDIRDSTTFDALTDEEAKTLAEKLLTLIEK